MRRTIMALAAAAFLAAAGGALAAPAIASPGTPWHAAAERVQYHQHPDWRGPSDFEGERWHRRQQRRAYEEERVAEAARREAWRIERERAERRAWRHAQREWYWRHNGH
ncbi:hypothetical protein GCM10009416_11950 [Craurococcus roseus]|uniref:Uncharacterized protein n=1 Tax=Craurococcus roseus TaxID=77585 RepID=A0ABP3PT25_9PROT